jgi:hypothetical protein
MQPLACACMCLPSSQTQLRVTPRPRPQVHDRRPGAGRIGRLVGTRRGVRALTVDGAALPRAAGARGRRGAVRDGSARCLREHPSAAGREMADSTSPGIELVRTLGSARGGYEPGKGPAAWSRSEPLPPIRSTETTVAEEANTPADGRSRACSTASSRRSSRPSWLGPRPASARCRASSSASSGVSCAAGSSPTASCACTVTSADSTASSPSRARAAASALHVAAGAWPTRPRTWWTASSPRSPCGSGCSRCHSGSVTDSPTMVR